MIQLIVAGQKQIYITCTLAFLITYAVTLHMLVGFSASVSCGHQVWSIGLEAKKSSS